LCRLLHRFTRNRTIAIWAYIAVNLTLVKSIFIVTLCRSRLYILLSSVHSPVCSSTIEGDIGSSHGRTLQTCRPHSLLYMKVKLIEAIGLTETREVYRKSFLSESTLTMELCIYIYIRLPCLNSNPRFRSVERVSKLSRATRRLGAPLSLKNTGRAIKKHGTLLLSISSPINDRFSKFYYWHTLRTIGNNVIIIHPTTP